MSSEPPDYPPPRGPFIAPQSVLQETAEPQPAKTLPEIQVNVSRAEVRPTAVIKPQGLKKKQDTAIKPIKPKTSQTKVSAAITATKRQATRANRQSNEPQYPGYPGYYNYLPRQGYQQQPAYRGGYAPYPGNYPYAPYAVPPRR